MRIVDKNTDFYDYYQYIYPDDTFTFDRTDSFILSKEMMCKHLYKPKSYFFSASNNYNYVLLQICNTFWLFLAEITKTEIDIVKDYELKLITSWHNYNKKRVLCSLNVIEFGYKIDGQISFSHTYELNKYDSKKIFKKSDVFIQAIDTNNYRIRNKINSHTIIYGDGTEVKKSIPILKACGIAKLISPLDVFLSFEEYFSFEKMANERREPIGTTDKDKIERHGFDIKTSFRG